MTTPTDQSAPQRRVIGRPFPKGTSGCPGGKRKEVRRAEKDIAKLLPKAMVRLAALLDSEDAHLVIEGLKLVMKYTLTTADKKQESIALAVRPTLSPEVARALAELNARALPEPEKTDA